MAGGRGRWHCTPDAAAEAAAAAALGVCGVLAARGGGTHTSCSCTHVLRSRSVAWQHQPLPTQHRGRPPRSTCVGCISKLGFRFHSHPSHHQPHTTHLTTRYLDMNGIIHNCTHANDPTLRLTETEMVCAEAAMTRCVLGCAAAVLWLCWGGLNWSCAGGGGQPSAPALPHTTYTLLPLPTVPSTLRCCASFPTWTGSSTSPSPRSWCCSPSTVRDWQGADGREGGSNGEEH